ncbi:MAG TPA: serine/threonine-protein kinase [Thermomicrobiaceae bacterium]|nr:serine/threonine-protein kinase [Thermomicrobiaceae bacterium]
MTAEANAPAILAERFRVVKPIGSGSYATVYLAEDLKTNGTAVAIKILQPHHALNADEVARFQHESRISHGIRHPNVVRVIGFGEQGDQHFLVMEWVDGVTLEAHLNQDGPLTTDRAVAVARQILAGLGEIHRRGIHLIDLKPANVLLDTQSWIAKIADLGTARRYGESYLIGEGLAIGTLAYMAPEHRTGGSVGPETDLYSLGVVLHEMLTGRRPFDPNTGHIPPMLDIDRNLPPTIRAVIERSLEPDRSRRYRTADDMSRALAGSRSPAEPARRPDRQPRQRPPAPIRLEPSDEDAPRRTDRRTGLSRPSSSAPRSLPRWPVFISASREINQAVELFERSSDRFERFVTRVGGLLGLLVVLAILGLLFMIVIQSH